MENTRPPLDARGTLDKTLFVGCEGKTATADNGEEHMTRVTELITNEVLRAEKNTFIFRLLITVASYVGITFWLNAIRQTASAWLVWLLIGIQIFIFLTIFVVCSLRLRQCRKHAWWLWLPLILSRVDNWEIVVIPATMIVTLILSELNKNISRERQHLLPVDGDAKDSTPS